jgi:hypothetical protein
MQVFKQFYKIYLLHKIAPINKEEEDNNKMLILFGLFSHFVFPGRISLLISLVLIKLYKIARITVTSRISFQRTLKIYN